MKLRLSKNQNYTTHIYFFTKEESENIIDFNAEPGEIHVQYIDNQTKILCGIGSKDSCTSAIIRNASARGIQKARDLKRSEVCVVAPKRQICMASGVEAALEGIILGHYKFSKFKSEKPFEIESCDFFTTELSISEFRKIQTICESVLYCRDLVNDNASTVTPTFLAQQATSFKSDKTEITILSEKEIEKKGLNLLYAVGKGSKTPPRLIIIEYKGAPKSQQCSAIVGKGITFDSGGQNLKPTGSIETMREDMAGAATVLGLMRTLSILKPKINVTGVIAAAHNAIGSDAFFPGDIYKSYSGKTVEIWSTDAEGRLVLADAISYLIKNFKVSQIVDLATLTGGVLIALGDVVAGLFSNNNELSEKLFHAGEFTNERLWRFPLYKEYSESLKGDIGDLRNLSKMKKGHASSIIGAAFIQEFVQDLPWAHLDIAGTAFNEGGLKGDIPQFATGFGVRLLAHFLLNQ